MMKKDGNGTQSEELAPLLAYRRISYNFSVSIRLRPSPECSCKLSPLSSLSIIT